MLRKFFDVFTIYDDNNKQYMKQWGGFTADINKCGNFILVYPLAKIICLLGNINKKNALRVRRIWMPTVKIDATIHPYIAKYILENPDEFKEPES